MRSASSGASFSNTNQNDQNFEIQLDSDRSEEMFTTRYLGDLGRDGWEVVAFHRSVPKFEAVLKRPVESNKVQLAVESGRLLSEAMSG